MSERPIEDSITVKRYHCPDCLVEFVVHHTTPQAQNTMCAYCYATLVCLGTDSTWAKNNDKWTERKG